MPKNLAVFDIDKTLSKEFLVVPIMRAEEAAGFLSPGTFDKVAKLLTALKKGEMEYEDAAHQVLVAHAAGLQGQRIAELHEHTRSFLRAHSELFRRFSTLAMQLLGPTHKLTAVTAEPEYMARAVAEVVGMDDVLASEYTTLDGMFTGKVSRSLAHRAEKRRLIGELRPRFAFGDSAGDVEMLAHAHYAFCISPDAELTAKAQARNWQIFNGETDATELLAALKRDLAKEA